MADTNEMPIQPVLASSPNLANPDVVSQSRTGAIAQQVGGGFMNAGIEVQHGIDMGYAALHGGDQMVPHDKAVEMLKANNYDSSGVPADGWSESALTTEMIRQQRAQDTRLSASRANLSTMTQFVAGVVGSLGDPITLAAGPVLGRTLGAIEAPLAGRAALGAAEGATLVGGEEALQNHLQGHDEDTLSWTTLRDVTLSAAPGALLHSAFGARPAPRVPMWSDQSFARSVNFTMGQEGGLADDTGGVTKFGISQKAHPGLDITKLNPADAASIYHHEYWEGIHGDSIKDPALASVAFDAAVNQGVGNANKWLAESGGDVNKYLELREQHYRDLAASNPEKYGKYLNGWMMRLTAFRVQMMGELPVRGEFTGPGPQFPHTGPEAGPHMDVNTKLFNDEWMRRYGGPTSPVPYSDEQMAVMRVMGGDSELVPPAFSDEYMNRFGGEKWLVLPKIEQRGPASPVSMGPMLQRFGQRMGADWEDRSNAARLAVSQLESDSPVNVRPAGDGWKNAFRVQDEHDLEVQQLHTQAMLDALPERDKMLRSMVPPPKFEETAGAQPENTELEHYKNAQAAAAERVKGLEPEAQEVFKNHLADEEATPEVGTLKHDEVTKGVQAAIQCGVIKGVGYGTD